VTEELIADPALFDAISAVVALVAAFLIVPPPGVRDA
jgi:hypothetical protein